MQLDYNAAHRSVQGQMQRLLSIKNDRHQRRADADKIKASTSERGNRSLLSRLLFPFLFLRVLVSVVDVLALFAAFDLSICLGCFSLFGRFLGLLDVLLRYGYWGTI